jgi:hypothetical protein
MVGVLIIFVGVIGIGNWITDLGGQSIWSSPGDMFEDLGSSVILIGSGGIIIAVSYMILGIARFFKGKYETR